MSLSKDGFLSVTLGVRCLETYRTESVSDRIIFHLSFDIFIWSFSESGLLIE
jgi:hypothetical protein